METLAQKIKSLLSDLDSVFYEIDNISNNMSFLEPKTEEEDQKLQSLIEWRGIKETNFSNIAERLYILVLTFLDNKKLPHVIDLFIKEMEPFYVTKTTSLLSGVFDFEDSYTYSDLVCIYYKYLNAFDDFGENEIDIQISSKIEILEKILNHTNIIIQSYNKNITSEAAIYNTVKPICQWCFPDYQDASNYSFQKTAKCYFPDILIPSLKCAIEYKYAKTETDLTRMMEQILADVQGYSNNPSYNKFYAVFYISFSGLSRERFGEIWNSFHFPKNWKPICVIA